MTEKQKIKEITLRLRTLVLFRGLLENELIIRFKALLEGMDNAQERASLYCNFVALVYEGGGDFGKQLLDLVLESENPAVRLRAARTDLPADMARSLAHELGTFTMITDLIPRELANGVATGVQLPLFTNTYYDFTAIYNRRLAEVSTRGYGIFAAYHMFTLGKRGNLHPVKNPDTQRLGDLSGYEREREQILINTRALLMGLTANNILLYGDAGTGKSSTVKAIGNEYWERGLRLIEIRKNQVYQIPNLMDTLAENPLKFILFIDDLSFPHDDEDFTALKAILEGNISARPRNIVVYATSNRRHMVRERLADRQGSDIHLSDTLEEEASLAARFGLTVTFLKPDKDLYASIVRNLAKEYVLRTPVEELVAKAEAHAIRHGGRSPRTARQFIEFTKASESI